MEKFKANKAFKKNKSAHTEIILATNVSALPLTPQEIAKRDARAKKYSNDTTVDARSWENVILRSRYHNAASANELQGDVFIMLQKREEQKKYHLHIKSIKKGITKGKYSGKANDWLEIIQCYRKLREAIVGENSKADKFVIKVYHESVDACLKAKELSDEKLIDAELAKGLLTLIEKIYPAYLNNAPAKVSDKKLNKIGLYYSYYLFYQLGVNSTHLGKVLQLCKSPIQLDFLEHADIKLATQMCISLIHLQYIPFFQYLALCSPFQKMLIEHVSNRLRILSIKTTTQAYLMLPTTHFLSSLGFSKLEESIKFIASLPANTLNLNRSPRFSQDYETVYFRPARP